MIETLLKITGLISSKVPQTILEKIFTVSIVIVDISLIAFSIVFGFKKLTFYGLYKISVDRVKKLLLFVIIATDLIVILQSLIGRKFENKILGDLLQCEEIMNEDKSQKSKPKIAYWAIKQSVLLLSCCLLSTVPIFCDKAFGIWEILLYSILFMNVTTFHYIWTVQKIHEKVQLMRDEIQEMVSDESLETLMKSSTVYYKNDIAEEKIIKVTKCYNLVCQAVSSLNQRFGVSILCLIFSSFLTITYCGYNFFIEIETTRLQNIIIGK